MRSVSLLYVLENKFDILFQHGTIRAKVLQMVDSSQEWQMEFRETQDGASEEHVTPELVRGACDTRGTKKLFYWMMSVQYYCVLHAFTVV